MLLVEQVSCRLETYAVSHEATAIAIYGHVPSGNSPVLLFNKCRPKYHPSPNSSSRSTNSTLSPFIKLNSSGLRAVKSSAHQISSNSNAHRSKTSTEPRHKRAQAASHCSWHHDLRKAIREGHLRMTRRIEPGSGRPPKASDAWETLLNAIAKAQDVCRLRTPINVSSYQKVDRIGLCLCQFTQRRRNCKAAMMRYAYKDTARLKSLWTRTCLVVVAVGSGGWYGSIYGFWAQSG